MLHGIQRNEAVELTAALKARDNAWQLALVLYPARVFNGDAALWLTNSSTDAAHLHIAAVYTR